MKMFILPDSFKKSSVLKKNGGGGGSSKKGFQVNCCVLSQTKK